MFDFNDVKFVKCIVVGSNNLIQMFIDDDLVSVQDLFNCCLSDMFKGVIFGIECSFIILQIGEYQVVLQWLVYYVGFLCKLIWMVD